MSLQHRAPAIGITVPEIPKGQSIPDELHLRLVREHQDRKQRNEALNKTKQKELQKKHLQQQADLLRLVQNNPQLLHKITQ